MLVSPQLQTTVCAKQVAVALHAWTSNKTENYPPVKPNGQYSVVHCGIVTYDNSKHYLQQKLSLPIHFHQLIKVMKNSPLKLFK